MSWEGWRAGLTALMLSIASPAFAQTESERFDIDRFEVEGNSLLAADELARLLQPS